MNNIATEVLKTNIAIEVYKRPNVSGLTIPFTIPGTIANAVAGEANSISVTVLKTNIAVEVI